MILRLLLLFTLIPLAELFLLIRMVQLTGPLTTVALVIVTGVLGTLLARRQGLRAWNRFRAALAEGRMPARELQDGLLIALAGVLLITPGLLTDTAGFLLLIPGVRELTRRYIAARLAGQFDVSVSPLGRAARQPFGSRSDTVEAAGVRPVGGNGGSLPRQRVG